MSVFLVGIGEIGKATIREHLVSVGSFMGREVTYFTMHTLLPISIVIVTFALIALGFSFCKACLN